MMSRESVTRRCFLTAMSGAAVAGTALGGRAWAARQPICVFTKPFQSLSYQDLAAKIAALGCDGIEVPVREGGHIEPEQVPEELPRLVEALRGHGLEITVLTSSVNDARDPVSESVLRTAAGLGIRRYRMKYLKYDLKRPVRTQLAEWRRRLTDLAALNHELGITAVYQNHAGRNYMGAALWDLDQVLTDIDPGQIGVAYDIRHATVEGGMSWPVTFRMIRPRIDTVYVKDFEWASGKPRNVPLGEGQVHRDFFRMLAETAFSGPISLHEEYLDHRRPELVPQHLEAIRRDLVTLKRMLR